MDETPQSPIVPRTWGRHVDHDPRSRAYPVLPLASSPQDVMWRHYGRRLRQDIGACTGNAGAAILGCAPFCTSER